MKEELRKYLGKSQRRWTMWRRFQSKETASPPDIVEDGFIDEAMAEGFLSDLRKFGIAHKSGDAFTYDGNGNPRTVPVYRLTEVANV